MNNMYSKVACGGMDGHYKFSNATFRDKDGRVVRRERLRHPPRDQLRQRLSHWPRGIPIVLEASFGWGWLSDLLSEAGLEPQLSNCYKLEQMRKARGWAKTPLIRRLKKISVQGETPSQTLSFSAMSADGPAKRPTVTENINNS